MNMSEIIVAACSVVSLIFTVIYANKNKKANYGQIENEIRKSITAATNRLTDILIKSDTENNQYKEQYLKIAIEQYLNSYEEACAKYLDSKVDKKRFRKLYTDEIKNIVEDSNFNKYFQFGSKYDAIKKVYDEWFNLEK